jgi:hypothetical protein
MKRLLAQQPQVRMRAIFMPAALLVMALFHPQSGVAQIASDQPARVETANADIELRSDGTFVEISEQQIRLQTQAAVQKASQMIFGFSTSMQRFEVLQAYTQKPDGRRVEVKKEAVFTRDLPGSESAPMFADIKAVTVVFPEVSVGDRVYARVRLEQIEPMFPGHYSNLLLLTPHALVDQIRVTLRTPSATAMRIENIDARPALISADTSFWVSRLPLLQNFNHVIAYLPALDLFLDPTSGLAFGRLPSLLQNKTAVIVQWPTEADAHRQEYGQRDRASRDVRSSGRRLDRWNDGDRSARHARGNVPRSRQELDGRKHVPVRSRHDHRPALQGRRECRIRWH